MDFKLGDTVKMTGTVEKVSDGKVTKYEECGLPRDRRYDEIDEGIVIQKIQISTWNLRASTDGYSDWYAPVKTGEKEVAYRVAYSLHRTPVLCKASQIS